MSIKNSAPNAARTALPEVNRRKHEAEVLRALALRVRHLRDLRGMSRKLFAEASRVSGPHIGRLEAGRGNVSVLVLDRLSQALGVPLESLFGSESGESANERALILEYVRRQPAETLPALRQHLLEHLGSGQAHGRRIALLGLRGAGKSSVGAGLAARLRLPFIELDQEIVRDAGVELADIFALYGQTAYRSLERNALQRVLLQHEDAVIATGGGIVTDPQSYELLLRTCYTVWLHARHEVYYDRTRAQGDQRISSAAIHRTAMDSIRRTIAARKTLYEGAQLAIDTSDLSVDRIVRTIASKSGRSVRKHRN